MFSACACEGVGKRERRKEKGGGGEVKGEKEEREGIWIIAHVYKYYAIIKNDHAHYTGILALLLVADTASF